MYETLPPTPHYEYTRTTVPPPPPPPPIPSLLTSTSQDPRSFDPEPHRTSRLPQYHHPPRSAPTYNALTSGSTTYSEIPPSTLMCFVYWKQFKTIPRSLPHLMDLSFLLSAPTDGSDGQHLATNHGPVFGSSPSPFCAKAYGLLSYLRFLYRVSQYTHSPLPKETILYTDSASVIAKIGEIEKWPYFFPNPKMDPDWDVLQQIITSRRLFPSLPVLRFAKGHQDVDCPYAALSLC